MFFDCARKGAAGTVRLRVRRHRPDAAYVLAVPSTTSTRPGRRKCPRRTATRLKTFTRGWISSSAERWPSASNDTLLMVHLRSRLQHVPPRDRPQSLARGERLSGRGRRAAKRSASGGHRLVADPRVRHRPDRHLREPQRQIRAGHRRAGDEADRLREEIAGSSANSSIRASGGQRAIKRVYQADKVYRGPYKDRRPDLIVGYAQRLSRLMGSGDRPNEPRGLSRQ